MSIKIKGKIINALPEVSGVSKSGNAWRKREYILETEGAYPKKICFGVMNDNIEKLNIRLGEEVEIDVDLESREYNGKWYHSVTCWNVSRTPAMVMPPNAEFVEPLSAQSELPASDDLPF